MICFMKILKNLTLFSLFLSTIAFAKAEIKIGDPAPAFIIKDQEGNSFDLQSRKNQWTVLYFYPKAETPGCTKQACAFRDNIKKIRDQGAEVFGISVNSVKDQKAFAKKHNINFTLLADQKGDITKLYGSKMPLLSMSKRWTYIIDPNLVIRDINKDVDPVTDAQRVADKITELKSQTK